MPISGANGDFTNSLNNPNGTNSSYPATNHSSNVNLMLNAHQYPLSDRNQVNYMSHEPNHQGDNGHHAMGE